MKTHETPEYEKLAEKFHALLGAVSIAAGVGMLLVGAATMIQARWHLKAAKEHKAEYDTLSEAEQEAVIEQRIRKVMDAIVGEAREAATRPAPFPFAMATSETTDGREIPDFEKCPQA